MRKTIVATVILGLLGGVTLQAQQASQGGQGPQAGLARPAPKPTPRWPDGRVSFSGTPDDVGNWEGPANASIFFNVVDGKKVTPAASLSTNKSVDEIPFQPGMRKLYDSRWDQAEDPHTRCKPSGGSRFWHTPYGIEIVDLPGVIGGKEPQCAIKRGGLRCHGPASRQAVRVSGDEHCGADFLHDFRNFLDAFPAGHWVIHVFNLQWGISNGVRLH